MESGIRSGMSNNTIEWSTDSNQYTLLGKIGQGAFASVWKARLRIRTIAAATVSTEQDESTTTTNDDAGVVVVAVKVLNLDKVDSNLDEIRKEVQLMRLSDHPNILPCYTSFVSHKSLWVVTPFMNKGSAVSTLQAVKKQSKRQRRNIKLEKHIWYILRETLKGLQYIHDNGQIHRDVKGSNILLAGDGTVKLADFGVSGWLSYPQNERAKTFVGTPCWMAPEVMEQIDGYDYKADIWSLGITALELAKGYAPYAKYPPMKVLILTIQEDPPSLVTYDYDDNDTDDDDNDNDDGDDFPVEEEIWTQEFHRMINVMLQKNPSKRPTCQELLSSNFLYTVSSNSCVKLRDEICTIVPDAGSSNNNNNNIQGNNDEIIHNNNATAEQLQQEASASRVSVIINDLEDESDRPPGTTWVFSDGSQVIYNGTSGECDGSKSNNNDNIEDVMSELDQFCSTTGGENYQQQNDKTMKTKSNNHSNNNNNMRDDDTDDGLNDFFDEFEKNTEGENFQRT